MSQRLTFLVSTAIVGIGVSAVSLAQGNLPGTQDSVLPKAAADPYAQYYGQQSAPLSAPLVAPSIERNYEVLDRAQSAPKEYKQYAQSYNLPVPSQRDSQADPYAGGPLAKPMPAQVQSDMSGGPLGTSMPAGTAPASGGAYYRPAEPAQSFPKLAEPSYQSAPTYNSPSYSAPNTGSGSSGPNYSGSNYSGSAYTAPSQNGSSYSSSGQGYPATGYSTPTYPNSYAGGPNANPAPNMRGANEQKSWWQKFGFNTIKLAVDGYIRGGVAGVERTDAEIMEEFAADAMLRAEISAVTDGGTEYGTSLQLRGQRDLYRRGFGGSVAVFGMGECIPSITLCNSVLVDGVNRIVKGHTGQLHSSGENDDGEYEVALESAHLFLRGAYGDFTLGRDDGAAALFSLDTPSTLPLARTANARVDYSGLDMTKTVNDASGFAEKITYTSPRLLGDMIGVGVQLGVSYAPSTEICGVDYCVESNDYADATSVLSPSLEDALEFGIALDRTFNNGFSVEAVANYAAATETSGIDGFDDLSSWGLGLNLGYNAFEFGASYLNSNNGWAGDGEYSAYDAALTWKPNEWGITASYGGASDELAGAKSRSGLLGVSRDFGRYVLGAGVQYTDRDVDVINGTVLETQNQDASTVFIEGGFTF